MSNVVCPLKSGPDINAGCSPRCAFFVKNNCALRLIALELLRTVEKREIVDNRDHGAGKS